MNTKHPSGLAVGPTTNDTFRAPLAALALLLLCVGLAPAQTQETRAAALVNERPKMLGASYTGHHQVARRTPL